MYSFIQYISEIFKSFYFRFYLQKEYPKNHIYTKPIFISNIKRLNRSSTYHKNIKMFDY